MAIGKYILMPWDYLCTPWFKGLSGRQMAVFLAMLGLSRMDKCTADRRLKVSLRVLGKELDMSRMSVKRTLDELVELEVVAIVAKGDGKQPAVYELAEPIAIRCAPSVPDSGVEVGHNGGLRPTSTPKPGTQSGGGGDMGRNEGVCVPGSGVNAGHYIYPPRGGVSQDSPSLGTDGPIASQPAEPRCEHCGAPMNRTHTFLDIACKYRIWKCTACLRELAISDEDGTVPGQPAYSTPKPAARARAGGQDAATAKFE